MFGMSGPCFGGYWRSLTSRIQVVSCKAMGDFNLLTFLSKGIDILRCVRCHGPFMLRGLALRFTWLYTLRSITGSLTALAFCPLKVISWFASRASGWADLHVESMDTCWCLSQQVEFCASLLCHMINASKFADRKPQGPSTGRSA